MSRARESDTLTTTRPFGDKVISQNGRDTDTPRRVVVLSLPAIMTYFCWYLHASLRRAPAGVGTRGRHAKYDDVRTEQRCGRVRFIRACINSIVFLHYYNNTAWWRIGVHLVFIAAVTYHSVVYVFGHFYAKGDVRKRGILLRRPNS